MINQPPPEYFTEYSCAATQNVDSVARSKMHEPAAPRSKTQEQVPQA